MGEKQSYFLAKKLPFFRFASLLVPVAFAISAGVGLVLINDAAKTFDASREPILHTVDLDLPPQALSELRDLALGRDGKRSRVGGDHYSAAVLPSQIVRKHAPTAYNLYWNGTLADQVSRYINVDRVSAIPKTTANMLIGYTRPGDHIGFHYDTYATNNGRMINVIVPIYSTPGSCSQFQAVLADGRVKNVMNTSLVFEGSTVFHQVTPQCENEQRFVWSLLFVVDEWQSHFWAGYLNFLFDLGYTGFRQTLYSRLVKAAA